MIKIKITNSLNNIILTKLFQKLLLFLLILSCSSESIDNELPNNNNNDDEYTNQYTEIQYGLSEHLVKFQGIEREFMMYIPEEYNHDSPSPLMFVFHGFGGSNNMVMYYSDFNSISERENFIVVYPQGSSLWGSSHWNVGGFTNGSEVDDVAYVDFLIGLISQQYNVNSDRLYATGMSNGGFFSFLLACQLSEKIAAIASVTGSMTTDTFENCDPLKEVPVMQIHGTDDSIVTYNGNTFIGSLSIESVLDYWKLNNYCSDSEESELNDSDPNDNFYVHRLLFDNGVNGSKVDHYKVFGGEHIWFMENDINSSELIWEFFSQHDLNGYIN